MLYVYHSNALDHLRDLLVEMVKRSPLDDPFLPDQILVQVQVWRSGSSWSWRSNWA